MANGLRTFNPADRGAWRKWLAANHRSTEPVCLVIFHKKSSTPNITYAEAVEEALCFGWIDNKALKRDGESMYLRFVPRKEKSNWSKLNWGTDHSMDCRRQEGGDTPAAN